jgi:rod shape-determining protein MreD
MRALLVDIGLMLAVLLVHTTVIPFVAIGDVVPDLPLLLVIVIAIHRGQIPGTVAGFFTGLSLDLLGGGDGVMGLSALTKTVAGFLAGYFYNENKTFQTLGSSQFLVIVLIAGAVHNVLYFVIFLQGSGFSWMWILLRYGLPALLYTAAAGLVPMFWIGRKYA